MSDLTKQDESDLRKAEAVFRKMASRSEVDADKLHPAGKFAGEKKETEPVQKYEHTPEMLKALAAKKKRERAKYDREKARRIATERLYVLKGDLGERLDPMDHCTLKNYQVYDSSQPSVLADIQDYLKNIEANVKACRGVMLYGPPGTGKDHLCVALARAIVIKCGKTARWIDGIKLQELALEIVRGGSDRLIRDLTSADVLILSDPVEPNQTLKDYQHNLLWGIVNERWLNKRITFVTSNCDHPKELEKSLGSRVMSRLRQDALELRCKWDDYRTLKK